MRPGVLIVAKPMRWLALGAVGAWLFDRLGGDREAALHDRTLIAKVRSGALGYLGDLARQVTLDADHGVVIVRGRLGDDAALARLEGAILAVDGVRGVELLVHGSGEPAPNKEAGRAASDLAGRRTGSY